MANLLLCYCTMCGKDGKLVSKRQRRQHYDEHDPHLDAPTRVISAVMREQTKKLKTRQTESATRAETESATRAVTLDDDSDQSAGPLHSSPYEQDVHNDNAFDGGGWSTHSESDASEAEGSDACEDDSQDDAFHENEQAEHMGLIRDGSHAFNLLPITWPLEHPPQGEQEEAAALRGILMQLLRLKDVKEYTIHILYTMHLQTMTVFTMHVHTMHPLYTMRLLCTMYLHTMHLHTMRPLTMHPLTMHPLTMHLHTMHLHTMHLQVF